MKRREFIGKTGCGVAGVLAATSGLALNKGEAQARRSYKVEIEIFENKKNRNCHKVGEKFKYPDDIGKICPWFLASMHDFIIVLQNGATLSWKYEGTPYEKVIDPDGVTTEFVRCPDPTANLVAKIIRTKV